VPTKLIPKAIAGTGLVSYVPVSKFADGLPPYRLEDILTRDEQHGEPMRFVTIRRQGAPILCRLV
jgi:hypothetical protein